MKCNQSTWCNRYVMPLKNSAHICAEAGKVVETVDVAVVPQQPAAPLGDMNSETMDGAQDSNTPSTDKTEGTAGDD